MQPHDAVRARYNVGVMGGIVLLTGGRARRMLAACGAVRFFTQFFARVLFCCAVVVFFASSFALAREDAPDLNAC